MRKYIFKLIRNKNCKYEIYFNKQYLCFHSSIPSVVLRLNLSLKKPSMSGFTLVLSLNSSLAMKQKKNLTSVSDVDRETPPEGKRIMPETRFTSHNDLFRTSLCVLWWCKNGVTSEI